MRKFVLIASTAALALSLAACKKTEQTANSAENGASNAAESAGAMASNASESAGNMASNAMVDVKQALSPTPAGQEFADKAAKSDAFEIAAAKLAKSNAASAGVKDFAAQMIKDHTESTKKIKAAADKASPAITPDATMTDDQNDKLADLTKKNGKDFDKAYIDGQVSAHQDMLAMMRDYAEHGDTPSLKQAAGDIAPVVQKHLGMAKALEQ